MTLVGFKGQNHPQQIDKRGALDRVDDRGTPPELFDPLNELFGFTVDVAAAPHNAKCERYYTREQDGLAQDWAGERVWCNPPYNASDLAAFTAKAWEEWSYGSVGPRSIVMLVPANRPEQAWWQDHVEPFRDRPGSDLRVEFLRDRRRFIRHDLGHTTVMPNERPPFGVCLLIWQRAAERAATGLHQFERRAASGSSLDTSEAPPR
jgi:phage N-6-adenine-methyltransferase